MAWHHSVVWHSGVEDPHTGGHLTLKPHTSEEAPDPEQGWAHTRIILKPLDPACEDIELTPADETEVRVIAGLVEVVGRADRARYRTLARTQARNPSHVRSPAARDSIVSTRSSSVTWRVRPFSSSIWRSTAVPVRLFPSTNTCDRITACARAQAFSSMEG